MTCWPASSPAAARTAALTGIMDRPPIEPMVVRSSWPSSATRTVGRLPPPELLEHLGRDLDAGGLPALGLGQGRGEADGAVHGPGS